MTECGDENTQGTLGMFLLAGSRPCCTRPLGHRGDHAQADPIDWLGSGTYVSSRWPARCHATQPPGGGARWCSRLLDHGGHHTAAFDHHRGVDLPKNRPAAIEALTYVYERWAA